MPKKTLKSGKKVATPRSEVLPVFPVDKSEVLPDVLETITVNSEPEVVPELPMNYVLVVKGDKTYKKFKVNHLNGDRTTHLEGPIN